MIKQITSIFLMLIFLVPIVLNQDKPNIASVSRDVKQAANEQSDAFEKLRIENSRLWANQISLQKRYEVQQLIMTQKEIDRTREQRLADVENTIKRDEQIEADKEAAKKKADDEAVARSQANWDDMKRATYGLIAVLLGSAITYGVGTSRKWAADRLHGEKLTGSIEQLHLLVNSERLSLLRDKLSAFKTGLNALEDLSAEQLKRNDVVDPDIFRRKAELHQLISALDLEISDLMTATAAGKVAAKTI